MNNPKIKLKEYREMKHLSQKQLATKLRVGQGYISKLENGKESPTVRMLYRIANALEICPHMLLSSTMYCIENNCSIGGIN